MECNKEIIRFWCGKNDAERTAMWYNITIYTWIHNKRNEVEEP